MIFSAIVPIKLESERLPNKNFKELLNKPLFHYVLDTLSTVDAIAEIIIDTDCPELLTPYLKNKTSKFKVLPRPSELKGNLVVMNALLMNTLPSVQQQHVIQTHVTNPLLKSATIEKAMAMYAKNLATHDSLISVNVCKKRFYDQEANPVNHQLSSMQSTQNLAPLYEENSNLFIFSKQSFYANHNHRIGLRPFLFEMHPLESVDIDELHEFKLAELLLQNGF